jgi:hypothetical protein
LCWLLLLLLVAQPVSFSPACVCLSSKPGSGTQAECWLAGFGVRLSQAGTAPTNLRARVSEPLFEVVIENANEESGKSKRAAPELVGK